MICRGLPQPLTASLRHSASRLLANKCIRGARHPVGVSVAPNEPEHEPYGIPRASK